MPFEYLLFPGEEYEGCYRVVVGPSMIFIPPSEKTNGDLDQIVRELILWERQLFPGSILSKGGDFISSFKRKSSRHKNPELGQVSVPNLLEHLEEQGFIVPRGYWARNHHVLRNFD